MVEGSERHRAENDLRLIIKEAIEEERTSGERFFLEHPDRWYEPWPGRYRCPNGHVSSGGIKAEGCSPSFRCQACWGPLFFTFPEDFDDPVFGTIDYDYSAEDRR